MAQQAVKPVRHVICVHCHSPILLSEHPPEELVCPECEGIVRLRYRNSPEKPELGNPGEIYHITVDLWATSNVFLEGHKLRLEVSSSNFTRFDRNLNTGEDQARGTQMVKATNVIYHDNSRPSALVLPIVP